MFETYIISMYFIRIVIEAVIIIIIVNVWGSLYAIRRRIFQDTSYDIIACTGNKIVNSAIRCRYA